MLKNAVVGLAVFGLLAAVAGYVWTALEFPFAILIPAAAAAGAGTARVAEVSRFEGGHTRQQ